MAERRDQRRFWQIIPIVIATVAVITALGAIVVGLRSSLSEPTSAAVSHASRPVIAQSVTPPAAASAPRVGNEQNRVSKALSGPLRAAQDTLKSRNYPDAIARLEAADRTQGKSPYDQHVINALLSEAYVGVKDYASAGRVVEAGLIDGFLTSSQAERETIVAALVNYQIKNYDKAIEFGSRAIRSGSTNPQVPTVVGQGYYLKGDWGNAERFEEEFVSRQAATGVTPDRHSLELWMSACLNLRDDSCEKRALEKLVAYYPTPETQRELVRLQAAR
jgi:hypothetical protein